MTFKLPTTCRMLLQNQCCGFVDNIFSFFFDGCYVGHYILVSSTFITMCTLLENLNTGTIRGLIKSFMVVTRIMNNEFSENTEV